MMFGVDSWNIFTILWSIGGLCAMGFHAIDGSQGVREAPRLQVERSTNGFGLWSDHRDRRQNR
jgi:hypothetical protein